jgi:hypothetical protein
MVPVIAPMMIKILSFTAVLAPMTNWVRAGRGLPPSMSAKIASNFGTIKTSKKPRIRIAIRRTIIG